MTTVIQNGYLIKITYRDNDSYYQAPIAQSALLYRDKGKAQKEVDRLDGDSIKAELVEASVMILE